jgi:hypothetical protein
MRRPWAGLPKRNADGSPNWAISLITSHNGPLLVTRLRLREHFGLLFFFSGHGAATRWGNEFVAQGAVRDSLSVSTGDLLTLANNSPASSVTLILDCCLVAMTYYRPGAMPAPIPPLRI